MVFLLAIPRFPCFLYPSDFAINTVMLLFHKHLCPLFLQGSFLTTINLYFIGSFSFGLQWGGYDIGIYNCTRLYNYFVLLQLFVRYLKQLFVDTFFGELCLKRLITLWSGTGLSKLMPTKRLKEILSFTRFSTS